MALQLTLLLLQELELPNNTLREPRLHQQEEALRKTINLTINHTFIIINTTTIIINQLSASKFLTFKISFQNYKNNIFRLSKEQ